MEKKELLQPLLLSWRRPAVWCYECCAVCNYAVQTQDTPSGNMQNDGKQHLFFGTGCLCVCAWRRHLEIHTVVPSTGFSAPVRSLHGDLTPLRVSVIPPFRSFAAFNAAFLLHCVLSSQVKDGGGLAWSLCLRLPLKEQKWLLSGPQREQIDHK